MSLSTKIFVNLDLQTVAVHRRRNLRKLEPALQDFEG